MKETCYLFPHSVDVFDFCKILSSASKITFTCVKSLQFKRDIKISVSLFQKLLIYIYLSTVTPYPKSLYIYGIVVSTLQILNLVKLYILLYRPGTVHDIHIRRPMCFFVISFSKYSLKHDFIDITSKVLTIKPQTQQPLYMANQKNAKPENHSKLSVFCIRVECTSTHTKYKNSLLF